MILLNRSTGHIQFVLYIARNLVALIMQLKKDPLSVSRSFVVYLDRPY